MAEDQGVNGDRWNDQFTKLLKTLNWIPLGDANMDLINEKDQKHGVDRLFLFKESHKTTRTEGSLIEAKNYKTTSYNSNMVDEWINTLDAKLINLKNSDELMKQFEILDQVPLRTGIIAVWFSDFEKYSEFRPKFVESMKKVKLNQKRGNPNRIYVLENEAILRLASLTMAIENINNSKNTKTEFQFFYPIVDTHPATRSNVLNPNYMTAKFILGDYYDTDNIEQRVVFYFGDIDLSSFKRLQQALANFGFLDVSKPLTIFTYQRDASEFRKISPDIPPLFGIQKVSLKTMHTMVDLPPFLID
jgi:hypothetical protein